KEAASLGQPIGEYDPYCKGYKDFLALAEELIGTDTKLHRAELVNSLQARLSTISASAEELLASVPPETIKPQESISLDEKLADFYGVRQVDGHVMFSAMYPRAKTVQIAGDFNDWMPEKTALQHVDGTGKWQLAMPLDKGIYRYRLVVDDLWQQDPYNDWIEMNPFGEFNSVLDVK
ncbi:MAG: hypothetical protein ACYSN7_02365, partial [Planctomycetota bacterium]